MTDYSVAGEGVTNHAASEPFGMICHHLREKKHGGSASNLTLLCHLNEKTCQYDKMCLNRVFSRVSSRTCKLFQHNYFQVIFVMCCSVVCYCIFAHDAILQHLHPALMIDWALYTKLLTKHPPPSCPVICSLVTECSDCQLLEVENEASYLACANWLVTSLTR